MQRLDAKKRRTVEAGTINNILVSNLANSSITNPLSGSKGRAVNENHFAEKTRIHLLPMTSLSIYALALNRNYYFLNYDIFIHDSDNVPQWIGFGSWGAIPGAVIKKYSHRFERLTCVFEGLPAEKGTENVS